MNINLLNKSVDQVIEKLRSKMCHSHPQQMIISTQTYAVILLRAGNTELVVFKILRRLGLRHRKIRKILRRATKIKSQLDKTTFKILRGCNG